MPISERAVGEHESRNGRACSPIVNYLDDTGAALNDLTDAIDTLEKRLGWVIRPLPQGVAVSKGDGNIRSVCSPMAERCEEMRDRVKAMAARVHGIIGELEC